jgi:hypothetical protein
MAPGPFPNPFDEEVIGGGNGEGVYAFPTGRGGAGNAHPGGGVGVAVCRRATASGGVFEAGVDPSAPNVWFF